MSEVLIAFMGLNFIIMVEHIIIVNRLDGLEQKINDLKGNKDGNNINK